jgi:hypothetical protein
LADENELGGAMDDRASDEFMAVKKPAASKRSAKKIKGVRAEKKAGRR